MANFTYEMSGGVSIGGTPAFPVYGTTGNGPILVQGYALSSQGGVPIPPAATFTFVASGGIRLSSPKYYPIFGYVGNGPILVQGAAVAARKINFHRAITGNGPVILGGTAVAVNGPTSGPIESIGGISIGGTASYSRSITYEASGGITVGGSAFQEDGVTEVYLTSSLKTSWNINQVITLTQNFSWNVGAPMLSWYRVEGACLPYSCPPVLDDGTCNVSFIANIMATNISDVCRQLKRRYLVRTVKTIKKWSRPARSRDVIAQEENGIPQDCNVLEEIPFCQISECLQLCDDYYLLVTSQASQGGVPTSNNPLSNPCGTPETNPRLDPTSPYYDRYYVSYCSTVGPYYSNYSTTGQETYYQSSSGLPSPYAPTYYNPYDPTLQNQLGPGYDEYIIRYYQDYYNPYNIYQPYSRKGGYGGYYYGNSDGTRNRISALAEPETTEGAITNADADTALPDIPFSGIPDYKKTLANSRGNTGLRISGRAIVKFKPNIIEMGVVPTLVKSPCHCNDIDTRLEIRHNFGNSQRLKDFLTRSGKTLPSIIPIRYSKVSDSWQGNIHFDGLSKDGFSTERWNILLEWQCTQTVASTYLGSPMWKFSAVFQVRNPTQNLSQETRLLLTFSRKTHCQDGEDLDFRFGFNVLSRTATTQNHIVQGVVFADKIGMFSSPYYKKNPLIDMRIASYAAFPPLKRVPIRASIFPDQIFSKF